MVYVALAARAAKQTTLQEGFSNLVADAERIAHKVSIWAMRMSDGEKLVWLSLFILTLFALMIFLTPKRDKQNKSAQVQYLFALATVVIFSFGAGWLFDGRINFSEFL